MQSISNLFQSKDRIRDAFQSVALLPHNFRPQKRVVVFAKVEMISFFVYFRMKLRRLLVLLELIWLAMQILSKR
jgi:hypothetical protein